MQKEKESSAGGRLAVAGSLAVFGTIGILRRYISLPSDALALTRGVIGGVTLLLLLKVTRRRFQWGSFDGSRIRLLLSGLFMGIIWILLFQAYSLTSVAVTTLCFYMQPTIIVLLSPVFFRERITLNKGICVLVAVFGLVLVSGILTGGAVTGNDLAGILCGLGAAVFFALNVIFNKKMPEVPAFEKTIFQLFTASAIVLVYMLLTGSARQYPLTWVEIVLILIMGAVHTGLAYALYLSGLKRIPMQTAAVLGYIEPVTAILLSALILRERLTVWGILGTVLILGSAFVSER